MHADEKYLYPYAFVNSFFFWGWNLLIHFNVGVIHSYDLVCDDQRKGEENSSVQSHDIHLQVNSKSGQVCLRYVCCGSVEHIVHLSRIRRPRSWCHSFSVCWNPRPHRRHTHGSMKSFSVCSRGHVHEATCSLMWSCSRGARMPASVTSDGAHQWIASDSRLRRSHPMCTIDHPSIAQSCLHSDLNMK